MFAKIVLSVFLFQSPGTAPPATPISVQEDLATKLRKHVSNYSLGVSSMTGALIQVSNDFQIPIGITWVNSPSARAERPFAWKDATVQEIIQTIANTQPEYNVQIKDGVIHVFPNLIPDDQNFLKLKIKTFQVHNTMVEVASFKLHMLLTPISGNYSVSIAGPGDSNVNVDLTDTTAETVLDAIVKTSKHKIWIVTFTDDTSLTSRGLRRARSLWSDKPTPDGEQPTWDFLRWGDPMPPLVKQAPQTAP